MGALNCFCWLEYGMLIKDSALSIVSLAGGIFMSIYTACFYIYCIRRSMVRKQILAAFAFYVMLWLYLSFASVNEDYETHYCGIVCCGMSILFYGSPLINLVHIIKTKSTSTLPFPIIIGNFFNTGLWWLYGIIIQDNFVKVPYCLGFILGFIQLSLFVIFPSTGRSADTTSFMVSQSRSNVIQKKHFENGDRLLDYTLGWDILLWYNKNAFNCFELQTSRTWNDNTKNTFVPDGTLLSINVDCSWYKTYYCRCQTDEVIIKFIYRCSLFRI